MTGSEHRRVCLALLDRQYDQMVWHPWIVHVWYWEQRVEMGHAWCVWKLDKKGTIETAHSNRDKNARWKIIEFKKKEVMKYTVREHISSHFNLASASCLVKCICRNQIFTRLEIKEDLFCRCLMFFDKTPLHRRLPCFMGLTRRKRYTLYGLSYTNKE